MFSLLIKGFLRSKIAVIGLSVVLFAGFVSIFIGRQHIRKLENSITQTQHFQQEHIERNVQFFHEDIGLLLYYLRFGFVNKPSALNALTIGQRDVNSSIQNITIRNLEGQKYDTDLFNPANLLAGNLDFSFVLIYLFPLLIVAFTYNLLSEEKEGGTWKLVSAQSTTPVKVLLQKFAVRAIVVFAVLAILYVLAIIILSIPFNASLVATIAVSILYLLFWFAISLLIVSLHKSSSINAVSPLSIWMFLTIVLPGAVNNYVLNKYPVPEAMATAVDQREGLHEKWDMDKKITMDKFYEHYPQFVKYPLPDKQFSWLWYYAMQQMGDDEAHDEAKQMQHKLWQREKSSELIAYFIPTLHAQHQLNNISGAGLSNYLNFLDNTDRFHEKMRLFFYPRIFEEQSAHSIDWSRFKVEKFSEAPKINWLTLLLPLLTITALLCIRAGHNFKQRRE